MNSEEVKLIIERFKVLKAWINGVSIQFRDKAMNEDWKTFSGHNPAFSMGDVEWRVKPEPREWYIALHDVRPPSVHEIDSTDLIAGINIVKVREVIE